MGKKASPRWEPALDADTLDGLKRDFPGFIRLPQVKELTALGKTTIYSQIHEGRFPDRVKLTSTVSAWRHYLVMAWIEEQEAG